MLDSMTQSGRLRAGRFHMAFAVLSVGLWAACGSDSAASDDGTSASCVPGQQADCTCEGGGDGVQTCNSAGSAFSQCECGTTLTGDCGNGEVEAGEECDDGNTDNDDGCSSTCKDEFCGDNVVQAGEDCDDGNTTEFDQCPSDCQMGGEGGSGGGGGIPSCGDIVVLAGVTAPTGSVWSANGQLGLNAGQELCDDVAFGSHVCTYSEVKIAENKGELVNVPDGTAWLHRTTPEMVNGTMTEANPGARCNNWEYGTDHLADGEFITFAGGVPTYSLDATPGLNPDNMFPQNNTPGLPCQGDLGGPQRVILCCNPCQE